MRFFRSSMGRWFLGLSVIPTIIITLIVIFLSTNVIYQTKLADTKTLLRGSAKEVVYAYELMAQGESQVHEDSGDYYFGNVKINGDYSIVDRVKEFSNVEVSLFYQDIRVVTTLVDENGNRLVGKRQTKVWESAVSEGKEYFDEKVSIYGEDYFGYYVPIHAQDDSVIGMAFAGIPSKDIWNTIKTLNRLSIIICIVLCVFAVGSSFLVTRHLLNVQTKLLTYLTEIDEENYGHEMSGKLYDRKDEYGIMAKHFVRLNDSLQMLVLRDGLTNLYNRRAAMKRLEQYVEESNRTKTGFTFCICDIDWFKQVNDTYGHTCGDIVLKNVAQILNTVSEQEGFAARWGGEEFVIALKKSKDEAIETIVRIADEIKNTAVEYNGKKVSVTMTFGVSDYQPPEKLDVLISRADMLLYEGKNTGRSRIVS